MNSQLINYINEARKIGLKDDAISNNLISTGWSSQDVQNALNIELKLEKAEDCQIFEGSRPLLDEAVTIKWILSNVWKHPFKLMRRLHTEISLKTFVKISIVLIPLSLIPFLITFLTESGQAKEIDMQNSLAAFVIVTGIVFPYIIIRLVASLEYLPVPRVLQLPISLFGILRWPYKTMSQINQCSSSEKITLSILLFIIPIVISTIQFWDGTGVNRGLYFFVVCSIIFFIILNGCQFVFTVMGGKASYIDSINGLLVSFMVPIISFTSIMIFFQIPLSLLDASFPITVSAFSEFSFLSSSVLVLFLSICSFDSFFKLNQLSKMKSITAFILMVTLIVGVGFVGFFLLAMTART